MVKTKNAKKKCSKKIFKIQKKYIKYLYRAPNEFTEYNVYAANLIIM